MSDYSDGRSEHSSPDSSAVPQGVWPVAVKVTRHICPFCRRGHSKYPAAFAHMQRCFRNPHAKGCKTCASYQPAERPDYEPYGYPGCPEGCDAGLSITDGLRTGCPEWSAQR